MYAGINGRVAIVTGGARGIGAAISKALAVQGCVVAIGDKELDPADLLAREIVADGGQACAFFLDVADAQSVQRCITEVTKSLGPVDILINNAGFSMDSPIAEMTELQWDSVVDVCLKGSWLMCREVAPSMIASQRGRIINITSRAHLGENNKSNYCAAKAGVIGLTKALSIELGPHGITVNAVAPGLIRTERVKGLRYFEDIDNRAKLGTPIKLPGLPEDVAAAVVFLASEQAGFVSGETVHVTGGRYSST